MVHWIGGRLYGLWVTFSMVLCSTLLFPWFLPRETTSGLMGRWLMTGSRWQRAIAECVAPVLDATVHEWMGVETCIQVYRLEKKIREILYPEGVN